MFGFAISPLVQAAVMAGSLAIAFGGGWKANDWRRDSIELERQESDAKAAARKLDKEASKAKAFEGDKKTIATYLRPIVQEVERVVTKIEYRDVCLDDDGMRLLRSAIRGGDLPASEPLRTVPGLDGTGQRE